MTGLEQRCWNHEPREAVCRCPECSRGFCRECVAEHENRLLCADCLKLVVRTPVGGRMWPGAGTVFLLTGILLAWFVLFSVGEAVLTYTGRLEQTAWLLH
jgi:hypothetical protein